MTGKDENPANYNAITDYLTENFKDMDAALQQRFTALEERLNRHKLRVDKYHEATLRLKDRLDSIDELVEKNNILTQKISDLQKSNSTMEK
eukprot:gene22768-31058_t